MTMEYTASAKTVEEAIDEACEKLGRSRDEVSFEIIDLPKKGGLFGLKALPAKVRVYVEEPEPDKAQTAAKYVKDILECIGIDCTVSAAEENGNINITLSGEGVGVIIGRRGETLSAIQYLAGLAANRIDGNYSRVTIDSGNYREKREKTLEALAKKIASQVLRRGRSITLEPMNPYERRIIHATISSIEGVESKSVGDEPRRRVVVSPSGGAKDPVKTEKNRKNGKNRSSKEEHGEKNSYPKEKRGRHQSGSGRREKKEPYVPTRERETAPAESGSSALYSKIELDFDE